MEILSIALPAVLALAADPIASLVDTAFVGHLGMQIDNALSFCILNRHFTVQMIVYEDS